MYSMPDKVEKRLSKYCYEFYNNWLLTSRHAKQYWKNSGLCYDEHDFIEYLNKWKSRKEPSILIETLLWVQTREDLPDHYKNLRWFSF